MRIQTGLEPRTLAYKACALLSELGQHITHLSKFLPVLDSNRDIQLKRTQETLSKGHMQHFYIYIDPVVADKMICRPF